MEGTGGGVLIQSDAVNNSILFSKGIEDRGIRLKGGSLALYDGGGVYFFH